MRQFKLTIKTGNSAFNEHGDLSAASEIARILRDIARKVEAGALAEPGAIIPVLDINGNRVGEAAGR